MWDQMNQSGNDYLRFYNKPINRRAIECGGGKVGFSLRHKTMFGTNDVVILEGANFCNQCTLGVFAYDLAAHANGSLCWYRDTIV